jgi:hypothetical protein
MYDFDDDPDGLADNSKDLNDIYDVLSDIHDMQTVINRSLRTLGWLLGWVFLAIFYSLFS